MKKRKQVPFLQLKRNTIVNLSKTNNIKGGFNDYTGKSCFEVCDTDIRECSWSAE